MTLFRNAVFAAAAAGLLAGLILAALQTYATVPLILQAETFEGAGEAAHDHGEAEAAHDHGAETAPEASAAAPAESHHHGEDAWGPEDGFERFAYTAVINIVSGIGFGLLLV